MLSFILLLLASSTLQPSSLHLLKLFQNYFFSFFNVPDDEKKNFICYLLHKHNNNNLHNLQSTFLHQRTESHSFFIIVYWCRLFIWFDHGKGLLITLLLLYQLRLIFVLSFFSSSSFLLLRCVCCGYIYINKRVGSSSYYYYALFRRTQLFQ